MTTTCIAAHPNDPPLALPGLRLCGHHHGRLARSIEDVRTLWPVLAVVVALGNAAAGGSHHGKPGSRPPCRIDVLDITDPRGITHAQVVGWARIVIEERNLSARPTDIEQAARLLATHMDWLAAQPWVDECLAELGDASYRIRRACNDLPDPPIGRCPDVDPMGEQDACGGPLRITRAEHFGDVSALDVRCARCGSRWGVNDLVHVGRVSPLDVWGTVPQVAEMLDAPERTVRRWVSLGQIRKNAAGQVRHADVWHILAGKKRPPAASTAEGPSTT